MFKERVMKRSRGFTLVEVVIVIVIVAVLAIVGVPAFKNHLRKAMFAEGRGVVESIIMAEKVYLVGQNTNTTWYYSTPGASSDINVGNDVTLGVDTRTNRYFNTFRVSANSPPTFGGPYFQITLDGAPGDAANLKITCRMLRSDLSDYSRYYEYENGVLVN
jgi:prepilin-type N-terminal cleavage/methylation domain-containing protein